MRTLPISRSSLLWAHVLTSVIANVFALLIVFRLAFAMGFRSGAGTGQWLAVAGLLIFFTLALTWVAVIPGLIAKTVDGAAAFSYPLIFLPFVSSAFVPSKSMTEPVRVFAENQPVTPIVDAIRSLLLGQPVGDRIWIALAWCVAVLIVAFCVSLRIHRRK